MMENIAENYEYSCEHALWVAYVLYKRQPIIVIFEETIF